METRCEKGRGQNFPMQTDKARAIIRLFYGQSAQLNPNLRNKTY